MSTFTEMTNFYKVLRNLRPTQLLAIQSMTINIYWMSRLGVNTTASSVKKLLLMKPADLRKMKVQHKETDKLIYCQSPSPKGWTTKLGPNVLQFQQRLKKTIFFLVTMTAKPRR